MKYTGTLRVAAFAALLYLAAGAGGDTPCTSNADCNVPYETCINLACKHKRLFPMELAEFFGTFITAFCISLSNAGGIGGGGLMMPIFMVLFFFTPHQSVPMSNFCIFGGAVVRLILNRRQPHPEKATKLAIDYELVIFLLPTILAGSAIGVTLNQLLPPIVIVIGLTAILLYLT